MILSRIAWIGLDWTWDRGQVLAGSSDHLLDGVCHMAIEQKSLQTVPIAAVRFGHRNSYFDQCKGFLAWQIRDGMGLGPRDRYRAQPPS